MAGAGIEMNTAHEMLWLQPSGSPGKPPMLFRQASNHSNSHVRKSRRRTGRIQAPYMSIERKRAASARSSQAA